MRSRCAWACGEPDFYVRYHDEEWGVPLYDAKALFALLCLEGMQAGLSWRMILARRADYFLLFDDFDVAKVARYDQKKIERLLGDKRIVRNRLKVEAIIRNAQATEAILERMSFVEYLWAFVDGKPEVHCFDAQEKVPTQSASSLAMSRQLKCDGFSFVGERICYAFMQASGMVNDHLLSCFCHPFYDG